MREGKISLEALKHLDLKWYLRAPSLSHHWSYGRIMTTMLIARRARCLSHAKIINGLTNGQCWSPLLGIMC